MNNNRNSANINASIGNYISINSIFIRIIIRKCKFKTIINIICCIRVHIDIDKPPLAGIETVQNSMLESQIG